MRRSRPEAIIPSLDLRSAQARAQGGIVSALLVLAVILGGSSAAGFAPNAVLQIAAIVALAATLGWARARDDYAPAERQLYLLCALFVALFAVQSIPLPPAIWTALSGRALVVDGLTTLGEPLPWLPLSLAPEKTLYSGLALLPPMAMIVMLGAFRRPVARAAILALLAVVVLSVLIGVAQVAGSAQLYLYAFTNGDSAVGFFANANHFGTLMCLTMPLVAGLVARWRSGSDGGQPASRAFAIAVLLAVVLLALLGIILTKSVAAVLLALLAITGSGAIVFSGLSRRLRLGFIGGIVLMIALAAAIAVANGSSELGGGSLADSELGRRQMWHVTASAIGTFGAAGAGFGAFPQVFHLFENPELVSATFVNHAHNDLLEFLLEGGIPGLILLIAFLLWFGARFVAIWLVEKQRDPIAQGASIAALVVLLHSLVDYPLRTAAIATIFGYCLAIMARKAASDPRTDADHPVEIAAPARHLSA